VQGQKLTICLDENSFDKESHQNGDFVCIKCKLCEKLVYLDTQMIDTDPVCIECALRLVDNHKLGVEVKFNIHNDDYKIITEALATMKKQRKEESEENGKEA